MARDDIVCCVTVTKVGWLTGDKAFEQALQCELEGLGNSVREERRKKLDEHQKMIESQLLGEDE